MAASFQTRYYHGASPGTPSSDVTGLTIRYKLADDDAQNSNNPVSLPASGESLSWTKYSRVNFPSTPAGSVSNLRFFVGPTSPPSGVKHYSWAKSTYTQPASGDTSGISGKTDSQGNKDANDETQRTSASPLTVNAGTVLSNPSTGEGTQDLVQSQLGLKSTYAGGPGPISPFDLEYRYAET